MSVLAVDRFKPAAGGTEFGIEGISKAWAVGSPTEVELSFNVSSFTDNGVGDFSNSFTNNTDTNPYPAPSSHRGTGIRFVITTQNTTSSIAIKCATTTVNDDVAWQYVLHGELA